MGIGININKAKDIAHDKRREARAQEFAPLDIKATIPSEAVKVEQERQKVREKYAQLQIEIDKSKSIDELKASLSSII